MTSRVTLPLRSQPGAGLRVQVNPAWIFRWVPLQLSRRVLAGLFFFLALSFTVFSARGGSSSASYSILHDALDSAGGRAQSGSYSQEASLTSLGGVAVATIPALVARVGFAAQLNHQPQAFPAQLTLAKNSVGVLALTGVDPDRDSLKFRIVSGPSHGLLSGTLPTVVYTPGASFAFDDQFSFVVNDGMDDSTPATVLLLNSFNVAPSLAPVPNQTISEGQTLSVSFQAEDANLPGEQLTFSLDANAPIGAAVNPSSGVFTWTPAEDQGPGSYEIIARVRDSGSPSLGAQQKFTVTVLESNQTPTFAPVALLTVTPGTPFQLLLQANDADLPEQHLSFHLGPGAPVGVMLDATTGQLAWTPGADAAGKLFAIAVEVTDDGTPPLSASQIIQIQVQNIPQNTPPVLARLDDKSVAEGNLLTFPVLAGDIATPAQKLIYSLDPGAPAGASINPVAQVFSWTPGENQGPGTYRITVRVTDDGNPALSDTKSFNVIVTESNTPPQLAAIADQTVRVGEKLSFQATATDPDLPMQTLVFSLLDPPPGALIEAATGEFVWIPQAGQPTGIMHLQIMVRDDALPSASAARTVRVNVLPALGWSEPALVSDNEIRLAFQGAPNACYRVEVSSDLAQWTEQSVGQADATGRFTIADARDHAAVLKLYRLVEAPCNLPPVAEPQWHDATELTAGYVRFTLRAKPNACFLIEATTDLLTWTEFATQATDSTGNLLFTTPANGVAGIRIFRVRETICLSP